jgi:hypothetical protein
MSFSDRFKAGPTLDQCVQRGFSHLRITCRHINCRHEAVVEVATIRARRDVPVNAMHWRCEKAKGGCGRVGDMIVSGMTQLDLPAPPSLPHPIFDLSEVKANPRRVPMLIPRKARGDAYGVHP